VGITAGSREVQSVTRDDNNNNNNKTTHSMFCGVRATLDVGPEVSIHRIASNME
jgi:hypothetical protein